MGKKLATVLAAVVATGHQGAVVQTAVQVTGGYRGQVYTRPSPPRKGIPAIEHLAWRGMVRCDEAGFDWLGCGEAWRYGWGGDGMW